MPAELPILAVCGWSGSGKTTLIEPLVRQLCRRGCKVAIVKHDVHGLDADRPGKDSDRTIAIARCGRGQGPDGGDPRAKGDFGLHRITSHPKIVTPTPSSNLAPAWRNVNTEVMRKSQIEY